MASRGNRAPVVDVKCGGVWYDRCVVFDAVLFF